MQFTAKCFNELTTTQIYEILKARAQVFVVEQKITCLDADGTDYSALHCFIEDGKTVIAYLRAFCENGDTDTVHIGRVLTLNHGIGLGRKLLEQSVLAIKGYFGCKKICLNSQTHATGFYEKFGFCVVSGEFLEAGVPHVAMEFNL